jgi:hypothetical protein
MATMRTQPKAVVEGANDQREKMAVRVAEETGKQFLWGHDDGRRLRAKLEGVLESLSPGAVLTIELKGIEAMDFSLASEVFGKLYRRLDAEYPGRVVLLAGLTDYLKRNLDAALAALGLMALVVRGARSWELIGKFAETDRETMAALHRLKQATAPELAAALDIKLTTCNQRLKKLTEAGLVVRVRVSAPTGGEQYVYRWPA